MSFDSHHSIPNHGLSATRQAPQELEDSKKEFELCPKCGSSNLITGAGLKPGQMSLRCSECKVFVGYKSLQKLHKLRKRKELTSCLQLLEKEGLTGDAAIFALSSLGGVE